MGVENGGEPRMNSSFWLVKLGRLQWHSLKQGALEEEEFNEGEDGGFEMAKRCIEVNVTKEVT